MQTGRAGCSGPGAVLCSRAGVGLGVVWCWEAVLEVVVYGVVQVLEAVLDDVWDYLCWFLRVAFWHMSVGLVVVLVRCGCRLCRKLVCCVRQRSRGEACAVGC